MNAVEDPSAHIRRARITQIELTASLNTGILSGLPFANSKNTRECSDGLCASQLLSMFD